MRDEEDIEALHSQLVEEYRVTRASGEDLGGSSSAASEPMKSAAPGKG